MLKVALNSVSGVAVLATNIIVAFIMSPVIVHSLGNRNYGVWELLVGLMGFLGVLELGTGPALLRYVADAWAREDRVALGRIFNTGLFSLAAAGMLGLLLALIVAGFSVNILGLQVSEISELAPVILLFGLTFALSLPETALSAYVLGLQAQVFLNSLRMVLSVIQALVTYHVLVANWQSPIFLMAAIGFCRALIESLLLVFWILLADCRVRFQVSAFSNTVLKDLLVYGISSTLLVASTVMMRKLVGFVIASTAGVDKVVFFSIPNRLVEYAQDLSGTVGFPLTPYFTHLAGQTDLTTTRQIWLQTTRVLQVMAIGFPVALLGLGEFFIEIWMGREYAESGASVLYILCAGLFAQGIATNSNRILLSLAKHRSLSLITVGLAPVFFILSIVLGAIWHIEGVAVAMSLFIASIAVIELTLACRVLGLSVVNQVCETALRFAIPILATGATFICLREIAVRPATYGALFLHAIPASTVYLVLAWFVVLCSEDRRSIYALGVGRNRGRLLKKSDAVRI